MGITYMYFCRNACRGTFSKSIRELMSHNSKTSTNTSASSSTFIHDSDHFSGNSIGSSAVDSGKRTAPSLESSALKKPKNTSLEKSIIKEPACETYSMDDDDFEMFSSQERGNFTKHLFFSFELNLILYCHFR